MIRLPFKSQTTSEQTSFCLSVGINLPIDLPAHSIRISQVQKLLQEDRYFHAELRSKHDIAVPKYPMEYIYRFYVQMQV